MHTNPPGPGMTKAFTQPIGRSSGQYCSTQRTTNPDSTSAAATKIITTIKTAQKTRRSKTYPPRTERNQGSVTHATPYNHNQAQNKHAPEEDDDHSSSACNDDKKPPARPQARKALEQAQQPTRHPQHQEPRPKPQQYAPKPQQYAPTTPNHQPYASSNTPHHNHINKPSHALPCPATPSPAPPSRARPCRALPRRAVSVKCH